MNRKLRLLPIICWLAAILLAASDLMISTANAALTAPMPPRTLVNHKSKQCAQIVPGDECGDVVLPTDWEYLELGRKVPGKLYDDRIASRLGAFQDDFLLQRRAQRVARRLPGRHQPNRPIENARLWMTSRNAPACQKAGKPGERTARSISNGRRRLSPALPVKAARVTIPQMSTDRGSLGSEQQPTPPPAQTQTTNTPYARNPLFPCGSVGLALIVVLWLRGRGG